MYINVLTEIKNKKLDKTFTYKVPFSLENKIAIGKRVLIPFNHLTLEGYIVSLTDEAPLNPKEILEVLDEEPVLTEEMLILGKFLHEKTLSSLTSCYDAMLPKALKAKKGTNINIKKQSYLSLKMPYEEALKIAQNEKQKEIILAFKEQE